MSVMPDSAHLKGQPLVSVDGETVGTIDDVYVDPGTGEAEFLEVKAGRFRPKVHFVPVARMSVEGGAVRVPYEKTTIVEAPKNGARCSPLMNPSKVARTKLAPELSV